MRVTIAAVVLLAGCDLLGPSQREKEALARVATLEKKLAAIEEKAEEKAEKSRAQKLDLALCLDQAEDAYWHYIELNGRKKRGPDGLWKGVWTAPMATWNQAAQDKANAISQCNALHRAP
jgi:hypothetical protein